MKNAIRRLTSLLGVCAALGLAQTTQELINDGKNTENVITQSKKLPPFPSTITSSPA